MVERRRGGRQGWRRCTRSAAPGYGRRYGRDPGTGEAGDPELFEACLCRSLALTSTREGFDHSYPSLEEIPGLVKDRVTDSGPQLDQPLAFRCEYADGMKATLLLLEGLSMGWTFAARLKNPPRLVSTHFYLPVRGLGGGAEANFLQPAGERRREDVSDRQGNLPVERTLLTSGMTEAGVDSLWRGQRRVETPHLAVRYRSTPEPTYRRHS